MTHLKMAWETILQHQEASTKLLMSVFGIGYAQAGRLLDELQEMGLVGEYNGSFPRKILSEAKPSEVFPE